MALRGLKGGGYITHEQMERVGLTDADVAGKTQADVEVMMSGVQTSLPPVVSSLEEAAAFVKSKEFKSKITTDLRDAVKQYTEGSHLINLTLNGIAHDFTDQSYIKKLDSVLKLYPRYKGTPERTMFIPWNDYKQYLEKMSPGNEVTLPAYTSTGVGWKLGKGHAPNVKMVIQGEGKHGRVIAMHSGFRHQKEVLYERNSRFKILKVDKDGDIPTIYLGEI